MNKEQTTVRPRPPLGLFHLLMHIGHLLEANCRSELAEFGLHHGQARVLMALDRKQKVVQARLATGMDIAPPTLSIMLKKLLSQGLVERVADDTDQRMQWIMLTAKGKNAVKRVKQVWGNAQQAIETAVADGSEPELHRLLLSIRNKLGGRSPQL